MEHCRRFWTQSFDQLRKTFEAGFASMQKGFTGTPDQLADYLAKLWGVGLSWSLNGLSFRPSVVARQPEIVAGPYI